MSLPDLQFPIRYIDLFAGVGGFHYGLDQAVNYRHSSSQEHPSESLLPLSNNPGKYAQRAFTCVYSNEWDKYANSVYRRHYHECDNRDIRTVQPEEIPDFDLLCGGFPCQAFSIAGNRRGFADTRGTLFFEIARILKAKQPRFILLENVKGLLSHDNGTTVKVIFATLDELGYDIEWQVVNSKNFGVPQNRERIIIVGHLRGTRIGQIFPIEGTGGKTLNYIGAIMSANNQKWLEDGKQLSRNFPQGQRVYSSDGLGTTLAAQAGGLGAKTGLYAVTRGRSTENWKESDVAPTVRNGDKQDVRAVITPDRLNKRQNGRRFKEVGEPSFTLTGQDIHGVMIQQVHELAKQSRTEGVGVTFEENGDLRAHRLDEKKSGISELAINFEDNLSNTVTSAHAPKVYTNDDLRIRRLTPVECERLQGFPDDWTLVGANGETISNNQRYKMMGNAVTTKVIEAVGLKFLQSL